MLRMRASISASTPPAQDLGKDEYRPLGLGRYGLRPVLWLLSALVSVQMAIQSLSRYGTYHNRTYDLAMYARQAWGLAHAEFWDPIVDAHFLGTHIAIVLAPLGFLGRWLGTVQVLLLAQSLAFGLAALPLARMAARRFGDSGGLCAALAYALYPNVSQVAGYEFHPGSLAVLPLALALEALDAGRAFAFGASCFALLACREDFALLGLLLGAAAFVGYAPAPASTRRVGAGVFALSLAYLAVQFLVLRPHFWATTTSFDLHFGRWGGSPFGIVRALFTHPSSVVAHFLEPRRLAYLPLLLLPLAFLPLLSPRYLLFTLPFLAINLISTFPTTVEMYSHYLTPAVPALVAAAFDGLAGLRRRMRAQRWSLFAPVALFSILGCAVATNLQSGGLPWSRGYDPSEHRVDERARQAARVVASIDPDAAVQAPDALLPHLAERRLLFRGPPPDRDAPYVVLDIDQRARYAHQENLLRTIEEPVARGWLARRDYGLLLVEPSLLLLVRDRDPRAGVASRYLAKEMADRNGILLTRCLSVLSAWLEPQGLELELEAHAPCPSDLALRIGTGDETKPARVDLLFDGLLSPAHLRDEKVFSWHALGETERARVVSQGLRIGALRASGAPPEDGDPISLPIPLIH
jgi:uncharacterized membrane protein